jgi:hypothetical protein
VQQLKQVILYLSIKSGGNVILNHFLMLKIPRLLAGKNPLIKGEALLYTLKNRGFVQVENPEDRG